MDEAGYWKPKAGANRQLGGDQVPSARPASQASLGAAASTPVESEWDWETASQSSARSGRSVGSRGAVQHALSLLAGVLALTNPIPLSHPPVHALLAKVTPDPSRIPTGGLTSNSRPCQTASATSKAAAHQASEKEQAHSRGHLGPPHPNNPTTFLTTNTGVAHGGGTHTEGHSVILDIGATHDIIGERQTPLATRVRTLLRPIQLLTAGGAKAVKRVGDLTLRGALGFTRAMIVPWSSLTLVSLPTRLSQGWTWSAAGREACLVSPEGEPHRFSLKEGLFRYKSNSLHNPVTPAAFNNAAGEDSSESITDRQEGPQEGKQGAKQGAKGSRGLLNSKTLSVLLTLMLTTWACGTNTIDPQLQLVTNELRASMPRQTTRPHSSRQATVTPSPISHGVRGFEECEEGCLARLRPDVLGVRKSIPREEGLQSHPHCEGTDGTPLTATRLTSWAIYL